MSLSDLSASRISCEDDSRVILEFVENEDLDSALQQLVHDVTISLDSVMVRPSTENSSRLRPRIPRSCSTSKESNFKICFITSRFPEDQDPRPDVIFVKSTG